MKRLITWAAAFASAAAILASLAYLATAPTAVRAGLLMAPTAGGGGGGCAQATTFIARTSGENTSALTTLICGLVADGLIDSNASMAATGGNTFCGSTGAFDRLWITAMANSTDAVLDICGHTTGLVAHGSPTFSANAGFTGGTDNGTTVWLDTGYTPSSDGVRNTLNSSHVMAWSFINSQSTFFSPILAAYDGANSTGITPWSSAGFTSADCNVADASFNTAASSTSLGSFVGTRTAVSTGAIYHNGAAQAFGAPSTSTALPAAKIYLLARDNNGSTDRTSNLQIAAASIGGALNATTTPAVSSSGGTTGTGLVPRICAYLTAVHGSC